MDGGFEKLLVDDNNSSRTRLVDLHLSQKVNERHSHLEHNIWQYCDRLICSTLPKMGNSPTRSGDSLATAGWGMADKGAYEKEKD